MITLWRLSNETDLRGWSSGGRWISAGDRIIVLDPTPLGALCARLALAEVSHPDALPRGYRLLRLRAPRSVQECPPGKAPAMQAAIQRWYDDTASLLLAVDSGMGRRQYLLNGLHPALADCEARLIDAAPARELLQAEAEAHLRPDSPWLARPGPRPAAVRR